MEETKKMFECCNCTWTGIEAEMKIQNQVLKCPICGSFEFEELSEFDHESEES